MYIYTHFILRSACTLKIKLKICIYNIYSGGSSYEVGFVDLNSEFFILSIVSLIKDSGNYVLTISLLMEQDVIYITRTSRWDHLLASIN